MEGQACLPNLIHSHLNREKGTTLGFSSGVSLNDRQCRGSGQEQKAAQGLGEGDIPQSLSSTLGVPGRYQFLKGRDCDCSHRGPPNTCPRHSRCSMKASQTEPQV